MNDARLDLRLPKELLDRVKAAADGSTNAWVRNALERALGLDPRKVPDGPLRRARDAAHNPKAFLEGLDAPSNVTHRLTPEGDVEEIPLPKIAPRRWGK